MYHLDSQLQKELTRRKNIMATVASGESPINWKNFNPPNIHKVLIITLQRLVVEITAVHLNLIKNYDQLIASNPIKAIQARSIFSNQRLENLLTDCHSTVDPPLQTAYLHLLAVHFYYSLSENLIDNNLNPFNLI
jgi:hypothetical protein